MAAKPKATRLEADVARRILYLQTARMSGSNALALAAEVLRIVRWSLKEGKPAMPPEAWKG